MFDIKDSCVVNILLKISSEIDNDGETAGSTVAIVGTSDIPTISPTNEGGIEPSSGTEVRSVTGNGVGVSVYVTGISSSGA